MQRKMQLITKPKRTLTHHSQSHSQGYFVYMSNANMLQRLKHDDVGNEAARQWRIMGFVAS